MASDTRRLQGAFDGLPRHQRSDREPLRPGDIRRGPAGYMHSAAWGEGTPTVSIHCYSPPLLRVGQYTVDEHGILPRRSEHGRHELMDHTVGAADPSRADG